jgi:hypothetical protein
MCYSSIASSSHGQHRSNSSKLLPHLNIPILTYSMCSAEMSLAKTGRYVVDWVVAVLTNFPARLHRQPPDQPTRKARRLVQPVHINRTTAFSVVPIRSRPSCGSVFTEIIWGSRHQVPPDAPVVPREAVDARCSAFQSSRVGRQ